MNRKMRMHPIGGLFALVTFGVFVGCVLLVLTAGAQSYRDLTDRDADSWNSRTCAQYIAARIRHADAAGSVYVGSFDGSRAESGDTLFLRETVNGSDCYTRIYCFDGQLMELFTAGESGFSPEDGTPVLKAEQIGFELKDGLLTVQAVDAAGDPVSIALSLRAEEGASS